MEEMFRIILYGTDEEKKNLLACMIHDLNSKLEHFEKTLKGVNK